MVQLSTQRWHVALWWRTLMQREESTFTASLSMAPSRASMDSRIPILLSLFLLGGLAAPIGTRAGANSIGARQ